MITQEELKRVMHYDEKNGLFTWIGSKSNRAKNGSIAGTLSKGYIRIQIGETVHSAHRLAWLYMYGNLPENHIDHINHIRSDNRIDNIRLVSRGENNRNLSISKRNNSGVIGVSWDAKRNKWRSQICINGKNTGLGRFNNFDDAVSSRKEAEVLHNYHPNHGK